MKDSATIEYIKRKIGSKQSFKWRVNTLLPLLLLIFITAILLFSLILVHSMSKAIEDNLIALGGGHITAYSPTESAICDKTRVSNGLIYSKDNTNLVRFKGVEDDYFSSDKSDMINLVVSDEESNLKKIVLSEMMAKSLELNIGDKTAILLYDQALGRVRPVYVFVSGIYSTGYKEFDQNLVFCDISLLGGSYIYEITTDEDVDLLLEEMRSKGIDAYSYKEINYGTYNNLIVSKTIFNFIAVLIALLAGLFSISISNEYILRDKRDIASAQVIGFSKKQIASMYQKITLSLVAIALALGTILSLIMANLTLLILPKLDVMQYPALQNYILNFNLEFPLLPMVISLFSLFLVSFISLHISLRENAFQSLKKSLTP